ncbi:hypothetical protein NAPIS_ORF01797 [Vairimorpha apis BRL 01]|uniref:Uncharacterized protein n=1 Tax=Vairimorpha apis BRL 01 TaxID=1037528 RepID=T0L824_9MICR|nr:hypothetical protein NAPIS_ORF01797 [Vairimorpha apis BRL 01]
MYIPSFSLSKIIFVASSILDLMLVYVFINFTWMPTIATSVLALADIACAIPIGIAIFWYFNRKIVYFSFLGVIGGFIYVILGIFFVWTTPSNMLFFPFLIVYTIIAFLNIGLKIVLGVNIFILKTFLIFDINIPSNFNYLQYLSRFKFG